ncbi:MAG: excinuclease ABC subunit UvrC [Eggerthellaceae bacterium]|nr:excinuclease ABC subunit UvrC [Eggerthellaceae bacterium]
MDDRLGRIKRELAAVPTLPGVYLWKDSEGQVIYVGKAKQLRARMRQYVNLQDERQKIPLLVEQIDSFEYLVTENEHESLVLEKNFIKQYVPFFNADFKDDKSYPFIAVTKGDTFPALKYTREKHSPLTRYFGPYTDSRAARHMIDIARRIVPVCTGACADLKRITRRLEGGMALEDAVPQNAQPCFDAHVGLGPGVCCGRIGVQEYRESIGRVERFLSGAYREFIEELEDEMTEAAEGLDFERAARCKARIDTINSLTDKQHAVSSRNLSADVIGMFREETITGVHVFMVREGRIVNSNEFVLNRGLDVEDDELLHMFLLRYYDTTTSIPREVIVAKMPEDREVMEEWLTGILASSHGAKTRFVAPLKGEKADLLALAETNAKHTLVRYKVRTNYEDKRINDALLQLESALALEDAPLRIECFDISTIHGKHSVASMVVFTNGRPDKDQYRRFKIRMQSDEANDFAMMSEVLARRYAPERMADSRFGAKPDLLIVDGGKPQLTAAENQLGGLGITDIALAGLAKRDEELFVPWSSTPVVLPSGSSSLYLVKQVRDEAHRFAITFHREVRGKAMTASVLDEVPGLGPVRKRALLKAFRSFKSLKEASLEQIVEAKAVPKDVAEDIYALLRQYDNGAAGAQDAHDGHGDGTPEDKAVAALQGHGEIDSEGGML